MLTLLVVVSLLIVNNDDLPASQFGTVFTAAGIDTLSYSPASASLTASEWPTLGSLIDNGTRLLTFMDFKADFTSVPYIIDGMEFVVRFHGPTLLNAMQSSLTSGKPPTMSPTRRLTVQSIAGRVLGLT